MGFFHKTGILSPETKKALFVMVSLERVTLESEAKLDKTKYFKSPGTIWQPCEKGECRFTKFGMINKSIAMNVVIKVSIMLDIS